MVPLWVLVDRGNGQCSADLVGRFHGHRRSFDRQFSGYQRNHPDQSRADFRGGNGLGDPGADHQLTFHCA